MRLVDDTPTLWPSAPWCVVPHRHQRARCASWFAGGKVLTSQPASRPPAHHHQAMSFQQTSLRHCARQPALTPALTVTTTVPSPRLPLPAQPRPPPPSHVARGPSTNRPQWARPSALGPGSPGAVTALQRAVWGSARTHGPTPPLPHSHHSGSSGSSSRTPPHACRSSLRCPRASPPLQHPQQRLLPPSPSSAMRASSSSSTPANRRSPLPQPPPVRRPPLQAGPQQQSRQRRWQPSQQPCQGLQGSQPTGAGAQARAGVAAARSAAAVGSTGTARGHPAGRLHAASSVPAATAAAAAAVAGISSSTSRAAQPQQQQQQHAPGLSEPPAAAGTSSSTDPAAQPQQQQQHQHAPGLSEPPAAAGTSSSTDPAAQPQQQQQHQHAPGLSEPPAVAGTSSSTDPAAQPHSSSGSLSRRRRRRKASRKGRGHRRRGAGHKKNRFHIQRCCVPAGHQQRPAAPPPVAPQQQRRRRAPRQLLTGRAGVKPMAMLAVMFLMAIGVAAPVGHSALAADGTPMQSTVRGDARCVSGAACSSLPLPLPVWWGLGVAACPVLGAVLAMCVALLGSCCSVWWGEYVFEPGDAQSRSERWKRLRCRAVNAQHLQLTNRLHAVACAGSDATAVWVSAGLCLLLVSTYVPELFTAYVPGVLSFALVRAVGCGVVMWLWDPRCAGGTAWWVAGGVASRGRSVVSNFCRLWCDVLLWGHLHAEHHFMVPVAKPRSGQCVQAPHTRSIVWSAGCAAAGVATSCFRQVVLCPLLGCAYAVQWFCVVRPLMGVGVDACCCVYWFVARLTLALHHPLTTAMRECLVGGRRLLSSLYVFWFRYGDWRAAGFLLLLLLGITPQALHIANSVAWNCGIFLLVSLVMRRIVSRFRVASGAVPCHKLCMHLFVCLAVACLLPCSHAGRGRQQSATAAAAGVTAGSFPAAAAVLGSIVGAGVAALAQAGEDTDMLDADTNWFKSDDELGGTLVGNGSFFSWKAHCAFQGLYPEGLLSCFMHPGRFSARVVARIAMLYYKKWGGKGLSCASGGVGVGECSDTKQVVADSIEFFGMAAQHSLQHVSDLVRDDMKLCTLLIIGCVLDIAARALESGLVGTGQFAAENLVPLVTKFYGSEVYQKLHAHAWGTSKLCWDAARRAAEADDVREPWSVRNVAGLLRGVTEAAVAAAHPEGRGEGCSCEAGIGDTGGHVAVDGDVGGGGGSDGGGGGGDVAAAAGPGPSHLVYVDSMRKSGMTAEEYQRLDVLIKFGELVGNVVRVGSCNPPVDVLNEFVAIGIMDLKGTGALHDGDIEFDVPSTFPLHIPVKASLRFEHCGGMLGENGEIVGTGEPNLTMLLRASHAAFSPDIVSRFPELVRHACEERLPGGATRHAMLTALLKVALDQPLPGEEADGFADARVSPDPDAPVYSMAAAHRLKNALVPHDQRQVVEIVTGLRVNSTVLADPEVAQCLWDVLCAGGDGLLASAGIAWRDGVFVPAPKGRRGGSAGKHNGFVKNGEYDELVQALEDSIGAFWAGQRTVRQQTAAKGGWAPPWAGGRPANAIQYLVALKKCEVESVLSILCKKRGGKVAADRVRKFLKHLGEARQCVESGTEGLRYQQRFRVVQSVGTAIFFAISQQEFWERHGAILEGQDLVKDDLLHALTLFSRHASQQVRSRLGGSAAQVSMDKAGVKCGVKPRKKHWIALKQARTAEEEQQARAACAASQHASSVAGGAATAGANALGKQGRAIVRAHIKAHGGDLPQDANGAFQPGVFVSMFPDNPAKRKAAATYARRLLPRGSSRGAEVKMPRAEGQALWPEVESVFCAAYDNLSLEYSKDDKQAANAYVVCEIRRVSSSHPAEFDQRFALTDKDIVSKVNTSIKNLFDGWIKARQKSLPESEAKRSTTTCGNRTSGVDRKRKSA